MIVLLPCYSLEDFSIHRTQSEAHQILSAYSALFHPALIEATEKMPAWERAGNPTYHIPRKLILIPPCCEKLVPRDWIKQAEKDGAVMVRHLEDRDAIAAEALRLLNIEDHGFSSEAVETFYALGFCHFTSELVVRKLRYMSNLDSSNFKGKGEEAVRELRAGHTEKYQSAIRRAFEILAESKTYFFPTAAKLLDLTWLNRSALSPSLGQMLLDRRERQERTNLVLPGYYLELLEKEYPEVFSLLKEEVHAERVTIIGSDYGSVPYYLLPPLESARQILDAHLSYTERLGKIPQIFGRNVAGYSPLMPQILSLTGYQGALFFSRDGWKPNRENQSRIGWVTSSGVPFPLLARTPVNGENDSAFLELPDRLGYNATSDHLQTIVYEHIAGKERPWLADMARMNQFAKVLGENVSLKDYFAFSGKAPFTKSYDPDDFKTNFLTRAGKESRPSPVSLWSDYYRLKPMMTRASATILTAALTLGSSFEKIPNMASLEEDAQSWQDYCGSLEDFLFRPIALETAWDDSEQEKTTAERIAAEMNLNAEDLAQRAKKLQKEEDSRLTAPLAETLYNALRSSDRNKTTDSECGTFCVNMTPVEKTVRLSQTSTAAAEVETLIRRRGQMSFLTLPPYSAAWVPDMEQETEDAPLDAATIPVAPTEKKKGFFSRFFSGEKTPKKNPAMAYPLAEEYSDGTCDRFFVLRNRFFEIKIDEATGQVRSIRTFSAPSVRSGGGILHQPAMGNRLAWYPALRLNEKETKEDNRPESSSLHGYTIPAADSIEILNAGPPEAKILIKGRLLLPNGEQRAAYQETLTLRNDENIIGVELSFDPIQLPDESPWENYYGVCFAWKDSLASLFTGVSGRMVQTDRDYLQSPEGVDIMSDEGIRLTILSGGNPFYRRFGDRRLDMVLIPKNELSRTFRFAVGVDLEDPFLAARRFLEPEPMVLSHVPAPKRPFYRFLAVEPSSVLPILYEGIVNSSAEEPNGAIEGIRLILQETKGKKTRCQISSRFAAKSVQATDLLGQTRAEQENRVALDSAHQFTVELNAGEILPLELRMK